MIQNSIPQKGAQAQSPPPQAGANAATPPRNAMQNLNPTQRIARRGRDIMLIGSLVLLVGLVVGALSVLIVLLIPSTLLEVILIGVTLVLLISGIGLLIRGLTYRRDNEIARAVGDLLTGELDDRFVFIRNLSRNRLGYIDALLIGPPGALVFRVTSIGGMFLNESADWLESNDGGRTYSLSRNTFTREAVIDIHALRKFLARNGLPEIPVFGVVVFTNGTARITTRQPVVPVAELRTLMSVLKREYLVKDRVTPDQAHRAVMVLYN